MQDLEMTFTASHLDSLDDRQLGELLECCGVFNYTDDVLDLYHRYPQFVEYLPKNLYNILSHHDSFCSLKFNRNAPDVSQLSADKIVHLMKINELSKYNEVVTKKDYIKYCHTGPIIRNNSDADETDQLIEFALDNDKLDVLQNHIHLLSEQQLMKYLCEFEGMITQYSVTPSTLQGIRNIRLTKQLSVNYGTFEELVLLGNYRMLNHTNFPKDAYRTFLVSAIAENKSFYDYPPCKYLDDEIGLMYIKYQPYTLLALEMKYSAEMMENARNHAHSKSYISDVFIKYNVDFAVELSLLFNIHIDTYISNTTTVDKLAQCKYITFDSQISRFRHPHKAFQFYPIEYPALIRLNPFNIRLIPATLLQYKATYDADKGTLIYMPKNIIKQLTL